MWGIGLGVVELNVYRWPQIGKNKRKQGIPAKDDTVKKYLDDYQSEEIYDKEIGPFIKSGQASGFREINVPEMRGRTQRRGGIGIEYWKCKEIINVRKQDVAVREST